MAEPGSAHHPWRQFYGEHRFGILLAILIVLIAGTPILLGFGLSARWFDAALSLLTFAAIASLCFEHYQRIYALAFGVPTLLLTGAGHLVSEAASGWTQFFGQLCGILFLLGTAVLIVRSLFEARTLTSDSIFGAVCGYLFLGLGWAVMYSMIEGFQPGSFQFSPTLVPEGQSVRAMPDVLVYYSFVTLTTVGYGDISPISPTTRTLAWIEALTGQFYVAVIVAGLVSLLATHGRRGARDAGE